MAGNLRTNRNEILKTVSDFWEQNAAAILGVPSVAKLVIADVDNDGNPDEVNPAAGGNTKPFARVRVQHTQSQNKAISGRRYRNNGAITANLFVPRLKSSAWTKAGDLADAFVMVLRSHRGNVYFVDVTPRERPINNGFNQVDVVAGFFWDQFGA